MPSKDKQFNENLDNDEETKLKNAHSSYYEGAKTFQEETGIVVQKEVHHTQKKANTPQDDLYYK